MTPGLSGRVVVVSPHLDDAVLSLGAALAAAAARGASLTVLTVFAGGEASATTASRWDALAGFATEGEAVTARRAEDARACGVIGAEPRWLRFSDRPYAEERDEGAVVGEVARAVEDADAVILPGFPLLHLDHRFVTESVLRAGLEGPALGVYAEQPYRFQVRAQRRQPDTDPGLRQILGGELEWTGLRARQRDRLAKWRAVREYGSQLPLLRLAGVRGDLPRVLLHEAVHGGEAIAWIRR